MHQFLEYFAILYHSQIVYKVGLLFSISAMIFNIKGSEKFYGKNLFSNFTILSILILAISLFLKEMVFENKHFYVRGESHFVWGALWMFWFLYWNIIHLRNYYIKNTQSSKNNIHYLFTTLSLNISFLLSAFYSYSLGLIQNFGTETLKACVSPLLSFEIVFDAPSIWCVFATLQGFFLYKLIKKIGYLEENNIVAHYQEFRLYAALFSLIIIAIIFISLPLFSTLSIKMITH